MRESPLSLIKGSREFEEKDKLDQLPKRLRGIYVLYKQRRLGGKKKFDVQYVGMAAAGGGRGLHGRLFAHRKSRRKGELWTHFSVFEVWDNIRKEEVAELEGLFRHIYRKDSTAGRLNIQRGFNKLRKLQKIELLNEG